MSLDLVGIIPPVVTPFTADGEIDEQAFRNVVRFNLKKKVHGVCVGGSSGEGHTLSITEFKRLMEICVEEVAGAIPVVAGIIVNSTRDAIARAKAIAHLCRSRRFRRHQCTTCSSRTTKQPSTISRR